VRKELFDHYALHSAFVNEASLEHSRGDFLGRRDNCGALWRLGIEEFLNRVYEAWRPWPIQNDAHQKVRTTPQRMQSDYIVYHSCDTGENT
jgi:hypothetical protein